MEWKTQKGTSMKESILDKNAIIFCRHSTTLTRKRIKNVVLHFTHCENMIEKLVKYAGCVAALILLLLPVCCLYGALYFECRHSSLFKHAVTILPHLIQQHLLRSFLGLIFSHSILSSLKVRSSERISPHFVVHSFS